MQYDYSILQQICKLSLQQYTNHKKQQIMLPRCKKNILSQFQAIRNLPKNSQAKSSILVLDTVTAPILSQMFTLEEMLEVGIKDLARADKIKKPEPTSIAIYYIECKSLQYIYKDFNAHQPKKLKAKQQKANDEDSEQRSHTQQLAEQVPVYFSINLLFCEEASQEVLRDISEHEQIIQRIASFGELYIPCRYADRNIGIVPFSKNAQQNLQKIRKISKMTNNKLFTRNSVTNKKEEQQKQDYLTRKRERTVHNIHKQNLSCFLDIYYYQFNKNQNNKDKKRIQGIQANIQNYGRKLCESIVSGTTIGINTVIKIVCYQSKFSTKIKQSFIARISQHMIQKSKELQQIKMQQSQSSHSSTSSSMFQSQSDQPEPKELVLIIADREADNLSPLIRSFYYQPLLMDVFDIREPPQNKICIISTKIKPTCIQVEDSIFCRYNNMFINEVFNKINTNLQEYISQNKAAKFHKQISSKSNTEEGNEQQIQLQASGPPSSKNLKQVLRELPQYKKTVSSYNTNIDVLNVIGTIAKERKLYDEAELQHIIVTGYGGDRKQIKDKKILQQLLIMLENKDITIADKCRLMVLAVCCLDIDNSDRNKIINRLSKVEGHGDIAMGLSKISNKGIKKYPLSPTLQKSQKQCYIDRHQCTLSLVLQQLLLSSNSLTSRLPKSFKLEQLKPLSVAKDKRPAVVGPKGSLTKMQQKNCEYFICMCGGLGFNEVSDIQRVIKNANDKNSGVDVNFVTDCLFTPSTYLQELCTLL